MDAKIAIVTYRQPHHLQRAYLSAGTEYQTEDKFVVINNHSQFSFDGCAKILHNKVRPDSSLGNLARSWNQALLWTFGSAVTPSCDWVCLLQGDAKLSEGWAFSLQQLIESGLEFIACGPGDQAVFMSIKAFKLLGWWDERFCGIGYHEFDYFLRAYLRLGKAAAFEGHAPALSWNWQHSTRLIERMLDDHPGHSSKVNPMLLKHLIEKWGLDVVRHIVFFGDNTKELQCWREYLDAQYGSEAERLSVGPRSNYPMEYNWYPHFYQGSTENYQDLYLGYCPI